MDMQKAFEVSVKIEAAYNADTYTDPSGTVWTGVESVENQSDDRWYVEGTKHWITSTDMTKKMINELMYPDEPVEVPMTDLHRANLILKKIGRAGDLAREAREELKEAAKLAAKDSYEGVNIYDRKDIDDVESVLRVAVTKPINMLIPRWIDIINGRKGK